MTFGKVSLIIPTYNEEKLIEKVLGQFDDDVKKKIIWKLF